MRIYNNYDNQAYMPNDLGTCIIYDPERVCYACMPAVQAGGVESFIPKLNVYKVNSRKNSMPDS